MELTDKMLTSINSPDILFLKGFQLKTTGQLREAINVFNEAFELYRQYEGMVSNQSIFLHHFIMIYKDIRIWKNEKNIIILKITI